MKKGKLIEWFDDKGYGFIQIQGMKSRIFVHISDISFRRRPCLGDLLFFQIVRSENGKDKAVNAKLKEPMGWFFILMVAFPFICSLIVIQFSLLPFFTYLVMGIISFFFYFEDKHHARMSRFRRSEKALHILEALGGWPGALIAQRTIRHKNKKSSYQRFFWGIVTLHVLLWAGYFFLVF